MGLPFWLEISPHVLLSTFLDAGGSAMDRGALGALLLLAVASGGCRMCSDCCDYLPPVANGEYAIPGQRAGSAFGSPTKQASFTTDQIPDPLDSEILQTLPTVDPEADPEA